jgi:hypothetical protein
MSQSGLRKGKLAFGCVFWGPRARGFRFRVLGLGTEEERIVAHVIGFLFAVNFICRDQVVNMEKMTGLVVDEPKRIAKMYTLFCCVCMLKV